MTSIIALLVIASLLFALPFFTKRRLGVLGLALAAGAMLSKLWVGDLTPIIASTGVILVQPPLESVVSAGIILLPAALLLFSSPQQPSLIRRVVGSLTFAILAVTLLLEPLGSALVIEGMGEVVYTLLSKYQSVIVTICLGLAVLDLFFAKTPRFGHRSSGKH